MSQANAENSTSASISRRDVESQIDALIELLDTLDPDPDAEPSLGSVNPSTYGEPLPWAAGGSDDREDEHDGCEPDEGGEPSLGWTENANQASAHFHGTSIHGVDAEDGVGPVRKKRPPSKTGRRIMVGAEVFR